MATALQELRDLAEHVDPQFQPTLNELPALFAALVVRDAHGADAVAEAIQAGKDDANELHPSQVVGNETQTSLGALVQPVRADEGVTVQGVPQAKYDALQSEVDDLRARFDRLVEHTVPEQPLEPAEPAAPAAPAPPIAGGAPTEQELYEQAQRASLDVAAAGHPVIERVPSADDVSAS